MKLKKLYPKNKKVLSELNTLIKYAKGTKAYKEIRPLKSIYDYFKLPITTSKDVRKNNFDYINEKGGLWGFFSSSGTTGNPKILAPSIKNKGVATTKEIFKLTNNNPKRVAIFFPTGTLGLAAFIVMRNLEDLKIQTIPFGVHLPSKLVGSLLSKLKPDTIFASPTFFVSLTKKLENDGFKTSQFGAKVIYFSSEPLKQGIRKIIETKWQALCYDVYGVTEIANWLACECIEQNGLHLLEAGNLFELPVNEGEIIHTSLYNYSMPLMRYKIGDIIKITKEKCKCGSNSPRIWIRGRTDEVIVFAGGEKLSATDALDNVVDKFNDLTYNYMFKISGEEGKEKLEILIESKNNRPNLSNIKQSIIKNNPVIKRAISNNLLREIKIRLVELNTLERKNGKVIRVSDNRRED